jgi:TonB-linked SusC/RagA family outer membrane protein
MLCILSCSLAAHAQKQVTGTVVDAGSEPIIGANVVEKGTTNGSVSDLNGNFTLTVGGNATLVISYIGYNTQEVTVGNRNQFSIQLTENSQGLDEVVVVGYGTQKRANLTGSVSTVNSKELLVRPSTNGASLLQGRVPGLNIAQNSGQPGEEGYTINLRGIGSFSNSAPFVLIDGVEGSLDQINPEDVDNMTVLKDAASASIYGSRASNGVILITTKQGRHDFREVEVRAEFGVQNVTRLPDYIYNSVEYMEMWNKSAEHSNIPTRYSQDLINAYGNASPGDPNYPNFNWMDAYYNTALRQNYQVAARGGGKDNTIISEWATLIRKVLWSDTIPNDIQ